MWGCLPRFLVEKKPVEGLVELVRDNMRVFCDLNRKMTQFWLAGYEETLCE